MTKVTVSFKVATESEDAMAIVRNALSLGCTLADGSLFIRGYKIEDSEPIAMEWP